MADSLATLKNLPPGVAEAAELVERFDDCLLHGFARLGDVHRASLDALAAVFAGSPLEPALGDAIAAVGRSEFVARHFLMLASARVATLGAVHDALIAQAHAALGRAPLPPDEPPPVTPAAAATLLGSTQQWLMELALAGFKHLEETSVAPFVATLEHLQAAGELTGMAALLTGFVNELLRHMPTKRHPALPVFRWGDLWSAAMARTQQLPGPPKFREVCGTLTPLGLDVQSHDNFVCAVLYGLLDGPDGGEARTVRVPFASFKVDVIAGAELWDLFGPNAEPVLTALAKHQTLDLRQAELWANGDLILRAPPKARGDADPFAVADRLTTLPPPAAIARHPVHIAEVVRLPADHGLPLAAERLHAISEFSEKVLNGATELVGLLRFDQGGWRVQPLCVRNKKGFVLGGEDLAEARSKLKNPSLATLRERASRLLRRA